MGNKIAICSSGFSPASQVDERFGRCSCFMIWDPDINAYTALQNTGGESAHGAGTGATQALLQKEVGIVISQRVGPKAFAVLQQAGIKVLSGAAGKSVAAALQSYHNGELQELTAPNS